MKNFLIGIAVVMSLLTRGALAQSQVSQPAVNSGRQADAANQGTNAEASSSPIMRSSRNVPMTPAGVARVNEAGRLGNEAAIALDAGEFAAAESKARESNAIFPYWAMPLEVMAESLYAQGKLSAALQEYRRITVGSTEPRTLLPYASLLLWQGKYGEAAKAYNDGIKLLPCGDLVRASGGEFSANDPKPVALEAAIRIAMGVNYSATCSWANHAQDDKAFVEYKKALALDPNSGIANYYYAFGLFKMGKTAEAKAAFIQTMRVASGDIWLAARAAVKKAPSVPDAYAPGRRGNTGIPKQ